MAGVRGAGDTQGSSFLPGTCTRDLPPLLPLPTPLPRRVSRRTWVGNLIWGKIRSRGLRGSGSPCKVCLCHPTPCRPEPHQGKAGPAFQGSACTRNQVISWGQTHHKRRNQKWGGVIQGLGQGRGASPEQDWRAKEETQNGYYSAGGVAFVTP